MISRHQQGRFDNGKQDKSSAGLETSVINLGDSIISFNKPSLSDNDKLKDGPPSTAQMLRDKLKENRDNLFQKGQQKTKLDQVEEHKDLLQKDPIENKNVTNEVQVKDL